MNVRFVGALLLGVAGCAGQAWAHGGVSIDQGQCIMKIGPDTMTFTGYQPQKSREQFCDDIPDVGSTIIGTRRPTGRIARHGAGNPHPAQCRSKG